MFLSIRKAFLVGLLAFVALLVPVADAAFTTPLAQVVTPPPHVDPPPPVVNPLEAIARQRAHFRKARRVIRRTYLDPPVTRRSKQRVARLIRSAPSRSLEKRLVAIRARAKREGLRRAEMRRLAPYVGPDGRRWALPWPVVRCESGGNIRARNGTSTAGGYGQAIDSTWIAYGGTRYPVRHPAAVAPLVEQHRVFARIWQGGRGVSHWAASRGCHGLG